MKPWLCNILPVVVLGGIAAAAFKAPGPAERRSAIGDVGRLEPALQRAFSDHGEFEGKKEPGGMDWLASHEEPGQTFKQYVEFGIRHCVHFECNMNGANHLAEADATPMHLCPVCLRKLHHANRFDPAKRYGLLEDFYREHDLMEEAGWVSKRIEGIDAAGR